MRWLAVAAVVVLAGVLVVGAVRTPLARGCSDVRWSSELAVEVPAELVSPDAEARVELCQGSRCSDTTTAVGATSVSVPLDAFSADLDTDEPVSATLDLTDPSGGARTYASRFTFADWAPDGPGCGTWKRHTWRL